MSAKDSAKDSHIFSTKNNSVFVILIILILNFNETLTSDVVSFEQLGPGRHLRLRKTYSCCFLTMENFININLQNTRFHLRIPTHLLVHVLQWPHCLLSPSLDQYCPVLTAKFSTRDTELHV